MHRILTADWLAPDVKRLVIAAPAIARAVAPGQFLIVRGCATGDWLPLMIVDSDPGAGSVTLILDDRDPGTRALLGLRTGDLVHELVGPLGRPTEIRHFGTVVVMGGGLGGAVAFPVARALRAAGNTVIGILGARTRARLVLEPQWRAVVDELAITTDDGSAGAWGLVSTALQRQLDADPGVDRVVASGPIPMLRAVASITRPLEIPTRVSLHTLMLDGTGLCGTCLVQTTAGPRFVCLDGPEFDGHSVNFSELHRRHAPASVGPGPDLAPAAAASLIPALMASTVTERPCRPRTPQRLGLPECC